MSIQKPDLPSVFCTDLRLHGLTEIDEDYLSKILYPEAKEEKTQPIVTSNEYTINKKRVYTCVLVFPSFKKLKDGKVRTTFSISIEPGRFTILPEVRKKLNSFKVIERLVKIGIKVEVYLVAYFAYSTKQFESVISLPYDTAVPPLEKVEVTGLRINVKKEPNEDYSQIVDLVREGKISHSISFKKSLSTLNASFITDLLAEASKYSKRLIKERGKGGT
jgi:hypothetical protein